MKSLVVCYVVRSFPEPSETFISEEAASLISAGVRPCIVHLQDGNVAVVHPCAQTLLDHAPRLRIKSAGLASMLGYIALWLLTAPLRTLCILGKAARHPARWCYLQALAPAWWCRWHKVNFLHAHFADVNFQYAAAMSEWSGIPFGVTCHGYDLRDDPLGRETASALFKKADVVVTISDFNKRYMVQRYGLLDADIDVVHCGVDLDRFAFQPRQPPLASEPLRLLNVGRLVPEKGQDILLRALSLVRERGISFRLDIIGGGELNNELLGLAEVLKIDDSVVFHGAQSERFVRELHLQADLFVLPSRTEGLPVACIEALAMGTPTIATRVNGIPELIEHDVSGLLVDPEDVAGLADAICRFAAEPHLGQQMRQNGRAAVLAGFDRQRCTQQLISIWSQCVA